MSKLKVAFIHPSLVIGGAEQLIVNLALSLIREGHQAIIYTPYHHNSFPETHDGTIPVKVCGNFFGLLGSSIFGKFHALMATIRTLLCTLWIICYGPAYDVVVCDQVSISLLLLKLCGMKTIFYCHFPDKLQSRQGGLLKKFYRIGLDIWEELCIWFADLVYVNSRYTQGIFDKHFTILKRLNVRTEVLYPAIDFTKFNTPKQKPLFDKPYFLSLNRYERKKNIKLAIEAFSLLSNQHKDTIYLVIAGGYDEKVTQNVEQYKELQEIANSKGVASQVKFMRNISDNQRINLLSNCIAVLYTPENEHFGIVPCQAMYSGVPVIAPNNGGPMESVANAQSGFLIESTSEPHIKWAEKMTYLIEHPDKVRQMGTVGKRSTEEKFGLVSFGDQFLRGVKSVCRRK